MAEDRAESIEITVTANGYVTRPTHQPGSIFLWKEEVHSFESFDSLVEFLDGHLIHKGKDND